MQMEAKLPEGLDNIHAAEIRFRVIEQPMNHALRARVSVSSAFNRDYAGALAVDGIKVIHMANEWSSAGEATPWIQLDWPAAVTIRGVRLFDRPQAEQVDLRDGLLLLSRLGQRRGVAGSRASVACAGAPLRQKTGSVKTTVTFGPGDAWRSVLRGCRRDLLFSRTQTTRPVLMASLRSVFLSVVRRDSCQLGRQSPHLCSPVSSLVPPRPLDCNYRAGRD